jgi:hypothetical protein
MVPAAVRSVTTPILAKDRVEGHVAPGFEPVAAALRAQLSGRPGGSAACVYHRGVCVVDLWGGFRDSGGTPWRADTMCGSSLVRRSRVRPCSRPAPRAAS